VRRPIWIVSSGFVLLAGVYSGCSKPIQRPPPAPPLTYTSASFRSPLHLDNSVTLELIDAGTDTWLNKQNNRSYGLRFKGGNFISRNKDGQSIRTRLHPGNPLGGETLLGSFDFFGLPHSDDNGREIRVYGRPIGPAAEGAQDTLSPPQTPERWFTHLAGGSFESPLALSNGVTLERVGAHTDLWRNLKDGRLYRVRFNAVHLLFRQADGSLARLTEYEGLSVESVGPLETETLLGRLDYLYTAHSGERGYEVLVYGTPVPDA